MKVVVFIPVKATSDVDTVKGGLRMKGFLRFGVMDDTRVLA
jgi:hypothetical protein